MFSTIDRIFHNQPFISTDCIYTPTTISLQHLKSLLPSEKIIFSYFILNSTRNQFHRWTNYSHYLINPRPIWRLNQPLKYTTQLLLTQCLVPRRSNVCSHSVLLSLIQDTGALGSKDRFSGNYLESKRFFTIGKFSKFRDLYDSMACFKRRATAVLSWLDCNLTAARH